MTQALKWLGIIAVVLLMLVVLAVLILTPLANRRQQAFQPLSDETLQQVLSGADKDHAETGHTMRDASGSTGPDTLTADSLDDSQDDDSGDQSGSAIPARPTLRLVRTLARKDILLIYPHGNDNIFRNVFEIADISLLKLMEMAAWQANSVRAEHFAFKIGSAALRRGDLEEARNYLREALEASVRHESKTWRNAICQRLAWVEQDPEVAAAFLEESCSMTNGMLPHFLQGALCLAILTDSDELADYYYARWNVLEPEEKMIYNPLIYNPLIGPGLGGSNKIGEWLLQRDPDFYRNSTSWLQEQFEGK